MFEYILKVNGEEKRGIVYAGSFHIAVRNVLATFGEVEELTIRKR